MKGQKNFAEGRKVFLKGGLINKKNMHLLFVSGRMKNQKESSPVGISSALLFEILDEAHTLPYHSY